LEFCQPGKRTTFKACRKAGIVAVSGRQLKLIEKLMMKLITKSQIEFGQTRYLLIVVQLPMTTPGVSPATSLLLCVRFFTNRPMLVS
jgi:hypothetical protein